MRVLFTCSTHLLNIMPPIKCNTCKSNVTKTNSGVTCENCSKSFHWNCGNLSNKIIQDLSSGKITIWKCPKCIKELSMQMNRESLGQLTPVERDSDLERMNKAVTEMQHEVKKIITTQSTLTQSIEFFNEKIDNFKDVAKVLNEQNARLNVIEEDMRTVTYYVSDLDYRVDIIEQSTLSNSIEIFGVPSFNRKETEEIIVAICSKLSIIISSKDISHFYLQHRKKGQQTPPSIIVFLRMPLCVIVFWLLLRNGEA